MTELFVAGIHRNKGILSFIDFTFQPNRNLHWSYDLKGSIENNCPNFDLVIKNTERYFTEMFEVAKSAIVLVLTRRKGQNVSEKMTDSKMSAMLGIFLAAAQKIMDLRIKDDWQSITATGTFKNPVQRPEPDGKLILEFIDELYDKFEAFTNYAKDKKCDADKRHLFIYISDEDDWEKELVKNENKELVDKIKKDICVRSFSPKKDTLFDILDCVFNLPALPEGLFHDFDRKRLFENFTKQTDRILEKKPIESQTYSNKTLSDILQKSAIFVYGPPGSGKSYLAVQLARYLVWNKEIYAPIRIKVEYKAVEGDKSLIPAEIKDKLIPLLGVEKEIDCLQILADKPFLIIIDDIPEDIVNAEDKVNSFLERMKNFRVEVEKKGKTRIIFISTDKYSGQKVENLDFIPMQPETGNIYNDIFEPIEVNHDIKEFDSNIQKFIKTMKEEIKYYYGHSYGYITGNDFDNLIKKILHESVWRGFYIHGEKGTGKSATAMAIAEHLLWIKKITAPIWINFSNPAIKKIIKKHPLNTNKIEEYIISSIAVLIVPNDKNTSKKLSLSEKKNIIIEEFSKKDKNYLVVIDNLAMDENEVKQVLEIIKKLFSECMFQPYLIITSRVSCHNAYEILGLQEEKAPKLNEIQITALIKKVAKGEGKKCETEIAEAEKNNTFNNLVNVLSRKFGASPYLIIRSIKLLKNRNVIKLTHEIEDKRNRQIITEIMYDPVSHDDYMLRGIFYLNNGQISMAIKDFNRAVKLNPKEYFAYYHRGKIYLDFFEKNMSIKNFSNNSRLDQNYISAYSYLGIYHIFYFLKNYKILNKAIKDFSKAIKIDPSNILAYHGRGNAYYYWYYMTNTTKLDMAINDYNEVIRRDPENYDAYIWRGTAFGGKSQHDLAIKDFDEAIKINPKNYYAYEYRGEAYLENSQFDMAIKSYNEAIEIDVSNYDAYIDRGKTYMNNGQYDLAIKDFDEAVRLNPKKYPAYINRGKAYLKNGQIDMFIKNYNEAIEADESNKTSYILYRGKSYLYNDQYDMAIKDFNEVLKISPKYAVAYKYRGEAYLENSQFDMAIEDFNKYIEITHGSPPSYFARGKAYLDDYQVTMAYKDFIKAMKLDPTFGILAQYQFNDYLNSFTDFSIPIIKGPIWRKIFPAVPVVNAEVLMKFLKRHEREER